jgi:hypothetical protein
MIIINEMERYQLVNEITLELGFKIYLLRYLEIQLIKYQNSDSRKYHKVEHQ